MLRSVKELQGYHTLAEGGEFGKTGDFLFDEVLWTIRYLVVDTGGWLTGRKLLIPPSALGKPKWAGNIFPVDLTKEQIKNSPPISANEPVSRQHEVKLHEYLGMQPYWVGGITGGAYPVTVKPDEETTGDPYLRSCNHVTGYHIQATDGDLGHVEDFLIDDENWIVRYMIVDTRNWLPGRKVLIAIKWIAEISWDKSKVAVDLTQAAIESSPLFDPSAPVNRQQEEVLFNYYGRPRYWL